MKNSTILSSGVLNKLSVMTLEKFLMHACLGSQLRFTDLTHISVINKCPNHCLNFQLNEEMMPQQVKQDVHAIILEFIRSRPPLHPVSKPVAQRSQNQFGNLFYQYFLWLL